MTRKIFGVLAIALGAVVSLSGLLLIAMEIPNWMAWGLQLSLLLVYLGIAAVGALLLVLGVRLFRKSAQPKRKSLREETGNRYNSSLALALLEFGKKTVWIAVLWGLILSYLSEKFLHLKFPTQMAWTLIPAVVIAAFWAFYWCRITVTVGGFGIRLYRWNRQYAEYPLTMQMQALVVKKRTREGLFLGTKRGLLFHAGGEGRIREYLWCIKREDFSLLVEQFRRLRGEVPDHLAEPDEPTAEIWVDSSQRDPPAESYTPYAALQSDYFRISKKAMLREERARVRLIGILLLIISASLAGAWYATIGRQMPPAQGLFIFLMILLVIGLPGILVQYNRYVGYAKKLPSEIVMTDSSLRIDEDIYYPSDLKRVVMSPAGYATTKSGVSYRRRLCIHTMQGKTEYLLGNASGKRSMMLSTYEGVITALRKWCQNNNILFLLDLE